MTAPAGDATPHNVYEDAIALISGAALVSLGVTLHSHAGILTGGTAGMALLAQYGAGLPFAFGFFLINIPFYLLAIARLGWKLTVRTIIGVSLVSTLAKLTGGWLAIGSTHAAYAAVMGGLLIGVGLLILFRHRISLGGVNLLALYAQERLGLSAGLVGLAVDCLILAIALMLLPPEKVALSLLAAVVLNLILAANHKPGRYTGVS